MGRNTYKDVNVLLGETLVKCNIDTDNAEIIFRTEAGKEYKMYHAQYCCESVYIEDVCGDVLNILGEPLLIAEEVSNFEGPALSDYDESFTWTYYRFATRKGSLSIRWYGSSNGYYSESVSFKEIL